MMPKDPNFKANLGYRVTVTLFKDVTRARRITNKAREYGRG